MGEPIAITRSFCVTGWAAWAPGLDSESAWRAWAGAQQIDPLEHDERQAAPIPPLLRRRVSPLGQAALRAAWGLPNISISRLISASRHGEFGRTLSILDSLARGSEVSPADFTLSVHHALIGLLSIAAQNREGHTAVAAGTESFGYALMEAAACLAETPGTPVIVVCYDEPLPAPFDSHGQPSETAFAAAFHLTASGPGEQTMLATCPASRHATSDMPQALDFLRFVLNGDDESVSRGARLDWKWKRYAAAA